MLVATAVDVLLGPHSRPLPPPVRLQLFDPEEKFAHAKATSPSCGLQLSLAIPVPHEDLFNTVAISL